TGGVLFRGVNVTNLILQNSYIVIMALGMLLVIVGGNIDLSVGSIVGFVGGCAAILMVGFHVPWVDMDVKLPWQLVIVLSLVLGGLIGASQGYFIAYSKIPAFIVTLAGMLIFRGLTGTCCRANSSDRSPRDSSRSAPASSRTSATSGSSRRR